MFKIKYAFFFLLVSISFSIASDKSTLKESVCDALSTTVQYCFSKSYLGSEPIEVYNEYIKIGKIDNELLKDLNDYLNKVCYDSAIDGKQKRINKIGIDLNSIKPIIKRGCIQKLQ